jgi:glycosyltransferase involved in cell wall biosynthesis
VLLLASYFPKPGNRVMGVWALSQAQALQRRGIDLSVVSHTAWVPRAARLLGARAGRLQAYADCPREHRWGDLSVRYPRWPVYDRGPPHRLAYRYPGLAMSAAWPLVRGGLEDAIRRHDPELVYAQSTEKNGFLARRLCEERGLPFVVTDHSLEEIRDCARLARRRDHYERIMGSSACLVAVTRMIEAEIRALVPSATTRQVYNGHDPPPERLWSVPRPPELEGRTVVLSVGGFYRRKGFPLLVKAFGEVAGRHPAAILRIVGDGEERPAVVEAIRGLGLERRVELLGFQPHERVFQEMVWADAFALPSWSELLGGVLLEAMAAGRPILFASDGGISELARDGVHGYSVEPRSVESAARALDRLLGSQELRRRMGSEGRKLAASLTWDANARQMERVFEEVLAGTAPLAQTAD